MSLAIDAVSSAGGSGFGPFTWSHANAGNVMFLNVCWYRTLSPSVLDTPTFNGAALTDVPASLIQTGDFNSVWLYLVSPSLGTLTASVSFSSQPVHEASFLLISCTGGNLTTPYGVAGTSNGTSTTPSIVITSAADEIVLDGGMIVHNGTLTVGTSQTERLNTIGVNGFNKYFGSTETGAASTTMDWTNSTSQIWVQSSVAVKSGAGGSGFKSAWARNSNAVIGAGAK